MKNKLYILLMYSLLIVLTGCGNISIEDNQTYTVGEETPTELIENNQTSTNEESNGDINSGETNANSLKIIGKITYDRVHVHSNGIGLNYNNITKEPAKEIVVKAIDSRGVVLATTLTDENGDYSLLNLPRDTNVKVRAYAQLEKSNRWSVKVIDNTSGDAQYVIEGGLHSTGNSSTRRNLNASSGWGGYSYTKTREAAPFAILGSIHQAMQKVISSDSHAFFPPLIVNWSVNNKPTEDTALQDGHIGTSHFEKIENRSNLYILGYANNDTDEYDDHIIIHEWGHYFESEFSRSDSPGGGHSPGERLDIRLAFGEGWGNAWSAIATDNPVYSDTVGVRQSRNGILMNIESDPNNSPMDTNDWSSEDSIQRILYDIYDSHNDNTDSLSMGFTPIYKVLTDAQKNTEALTSIFSFVTALKDENPTEANSIDKLLRGEDISSINDIYGEEQHSIYSDMEIGDVKEVCTSVEYGYVNKLNTHKYIRFVVYQDRNYKIKMLEKNKNFSSDPDFSLYRVGVKHEDMGSSRGSEQGVEENTIYLTAGQYILDASNFNKKDTCFNVTITPN